MAAPQPAVQFPSEITHGELELHHKAGASIHYSLARGTEWDSSNVLIVFLNGLMSDKASWLPVMAGIIRQRKGTAAGIPSMLAYDRYGQGMTSDSDPQDKGREKGHGHDVADAALDLHALIAQVLRGRNHQIILVGNSIGCAIARIYSESNPPAAILFLDSIMANSNFDFWPNHDAPDFEKASIPADVAIETLREQRAKFMSIFRPDAPNKEGLSRRSLAKLLPRSDHPPLGDSGAGPWVTVVGHDFETFADESLKTMGTPKSLSMRYSNPAWHKYNEGLAKITDPTFSKGPIQAEGCGHFIQRDDPNFVIDETLDLVDKIRLEKSAKW